MSVALSLQSILAITKPVTTYNTNFLLLLIYIVLVMLDFGQELVAPIRL